jgi:hypothetical protein
MSLWILFFSLIGFGVLTTVYMLYLYYSCGFLYIYIFAMIAYFGPQLFEVYRNKDRMTIHVHHWCIGYMIMMWLGYQNSFVIALHAVANGIFIEGSARWGNESWWYIYNDTSSTSKVVVQEGIENEEPTT